MNSDLAGGKRAEHGGGELRVVHLLLLILLVVLLITLLIVGTGAAVDELDGRTTRLVGELVTEGNVRDPDVTGRRNDRRFTGSGGKTPASSCTIVSNVLAAAERVDTYQSATETTIFEVECEGRGGE